MKKTMLILTITVFLWGIMTGCVGESVTPTDVAITADNSAETVKNTDVESKETHAVDSAVESKISVSTVQDKTETAESKPKTQDVSVSVNKKDASDDSRTANNNTSNLSDGTDGTNAMPPYEEVAKFTSLADFENWMKQGGSFEDRRAEILANTQTANQLSTTTYYRPKLNNGNDWLELHQITVDDEYLQYRYVKPGVSAYQGALDIKIPLKDGLFQNWKELDAIDRYDDNIDLGTKVCNGVEYRCFYYPETTNSTRVFWQQNGICYLAVVDEWNDQLTQILPLLQVERVTYNANPDHVTQ